jgi:NAD(P)-dependent dehydrogenase (short-subunit alcohol dehydrogenase family)
MHSSDQKPVRSPFGAQSTADDVIRGINLSSKNIVITGGYCGTGIHIVKALTGAGAHVTALMRDTKRAKRALRRVANVSVGYIDLYRPDTVDAAIQKLLKLDTPIDVLINHAAVMNIPRCTDSRGYEQHFATNHLGHFQLTKGLLPLLKMAGNARVVAVASRGHRAGGVIFDDVNFDHTQYEPMRAYGQSKSANILFAVGLDTRVKQYGIRAFAVHPGPIPSTDLFAESIIGIKSTPYVSLLRLSAKIMRSFHLTELLNALRRPKNSHDLFKTVRQGAATTVWAATSPLLDDVGGVFLEDCDIGRVVPDDPTISYGVREYAIDYGNAERLWKLSEQMLMKPVL